jgi:hypothetical protein
MLNVLARCAAVVLLVATLSGCLFESSLDANGGGSMTITIQLGKSADFPVVKKKLESSAVTVTSAEESPLADGVRAVYKIQFDDVTKLASTEFFKNVVVTRADGVEGNKIVTATVKRERAAQLSDAVLEKLGKEIKVVLTLPGPVIESNGKVSDGTTVTWTWGMREFHAEREVMLTVAYKPAATTPVPTPVATP